MKGQTGATASILLMAVTVASAGTVYTTINDDIERSTDTNTDIGFNTDTLEYENCYVDSTTTRVIFRNTGSEPFNSSQMTFIVNGQIQSFNTSKEIIDSQSTFEAEINKWLNSGDQIQVTDGDKQSEINCYNLPVSYKTTPAQIDEGGGEIEGITFSNSNPTILNSNSSNICAGDFCDYSEGDCTDYDTNNCKIDASGDNISGGIQTNYITSSNTICIGAKCNKPGAGTSTNFLINESDDMDGFIMVDNIHGKDSNLCIGTDCQ